MERSQDFEVSADELWHAVTDPEQMGWLGDEIELEVEPGGGGRITDGDETRRIVIDTVDAGRRLSFRWWPEHDEHQVSQVDLLVVAVPHGSRLVVRETLTGSLRSADTISASVAAETSRWNNRLLVLGLTSWLTTGTGAPTGPHHNLATLARA